MAEKHLLILLLLYVTLQFSSSSPSDHFYNVGELVQLFVNKVGPFNNPIEFLGEVLNGDRLRNALYEFKFREDKIDETLCPKKLTVDEIGFFKRAIDRESYFQFYLDDLPFWGFIGKL
ncbi:hypothetical protein VIGAN_02164000 [Vigna angularis var. angularis]|uniref:Transmembrane 9 superfamily member n=1 Tax=Vigna angularis var. angularis TaxID=157739 RepID=A0A0S3RDW5_PHAAN|nr:hypothetical protein VIGAN_02164000 [Vigna angularis var. angularis]